MDCRKIISNIYGELGTFKRVKPSLYRSQSGRVHLLGLGQVGGKAGGTIYLDKMSLDMGYRTPGHSLVVCNDYFGLPPQPVKTPVKINQIAFAKVERLVDIINELGFTLPIAVRSSSPLEDQIGSTAAGVFSTQFCHRPQKNEASIIEFGQRILAVVNSNYTDKAKNYYRIKGYSDIPPISLIIQEVIGNEWSYAPSYYFPLVSGIINTATEGIIKIVAFAGLGIGAVDGDGLGYVYSYDKTDFSKYSDQRIAHHQLWYFDVNKGDVAPISRERDSIKNRELMDRFYEGLTEMIGGHPLQLIMLAARHEKNLGLPVDIEWALDKEMVPTLLQIRPLKAKMYNLQTPIVEGDKLLFSSEDVLGQGKIAFKYVIHVLGQFIDLGERLELLHAKYPDSLIVIEDAVCDGFDDIMLESVLPHGKAFAVVESFPNHPNRSGIDHFCLNCADLDVVLMYAKNLSMLDSLTAEAKLIESINKHDWEKIKIYEMNSTVHMAVDDENALGMIYKE